MIPTLRIANHLEKEIRRLPREQREVVMLKVWSGMTFAEVAQTLAIPPGTAASRYRLAVAALRATRALTLARASAPDLVRLLEKSAAAYAAGRMP